MTIKRQTLALIVPAILFIMMVLLARTSWFIAQPEALSIGLVFDFTLTIPIVYFLIVRKTSIPNITMVPIFIIGTILASYVIPQDQQFYLTQIKTWIIPVVELGVLSFVIYKIRQINLEFKKQKTEQASFYDTLKQAVAEILPKPIDVFFATEMATFYYGFFHWRKRKLKSNEFSYHKDNGAIALFIVIIGLVVIETGIIHLLLTRWSPLAAWILSGISIYTGLQLFGFMRSMSKLPIEITDNQLVLRYGLMTSMKVSFESIDTVELSTKDLDENTTVKKLSILGNLEAHNVIVHFNQPSTFNSLYGFKKTCDGLALHIDAPSEFKKALDTKISS